MGLFCERFEIDEARRVLQALVFFWNTSWTVLRVPSLYVIRKYSFQVLVGHIS